MFGALAASAREQRRVLGDASDLIAYLGVVRAAITAAARDAALPGETLGGLADLAHYLRLDLGHAPAETVRILYLSARHRLLADEILAVGSASVAPLSVRPIVHRALDLGAAGLVLVHNHPSGDPAPSRADLDATRGLVAACRALDLDLLDHLIVARGGWTSLKAQGLL